MAIIRCKMCGGDLVLLDGGTIARCEYCDSIQTVPSPDNEKKLTLFARANRLRAACEFDKAAGIYEAIAAEFPEEPESYWGLVLCQYGIEYVDDPRSGKKVPTCHRSAFDSVMDDPNFEQALENADIASRRIYREEAKTIEELRKGIIEVSNKEAPYDMFICYKERDEKGDRTLDSVLAQDLYDALTDRGYRVFFARISLEDKLGQEYEPYIFAALNSAKIMLVVGTDYEYFNAVWVKNEWSRFLKLMEKDKSKHLIPCFRGIDAYDLPKEFARLQAQDLGKLGAVQDILRGIEKLMPRKTAPVLSQPVSGTTNNQAVEDLLRKARIHLEDQSWKNVQDTCKSVTAIDPENPWAYIYQLARVRRVTDPEALASCVTPLSDSNFYTKALRYADPALAAKLRAWDEGSRETCRLAEERCEKGRLNAQKVRGLLSGGAEHTVAVLTDGTVVACGSNEKGQCETKSWRNVIAVVCGRDHTVGLRDDGTVVACGDNEKGQCEVADWKNIVAIASDEDHTVGVCSDGTVVSCGSDANGKRNVSQWNDIKYASCGYHHTLGIKSDGSVVATGSNRYGQCKVESWSNVSYVASNNVQSMGLYKNGTVIACGNTDDNRIDTKLWRDIVDVAMGTHHTVGVKADGTMVTCGMDGQGRCSGTSGWTDIVGVAKTFWHSLAIRSDGTVVACGDNDNGKCDTSRWKLFDNIDTLEEERIAAREARKAQDEAEEKVRELQQRRRQKSEKLIAAGREHQLNMKRNGSILAWGANDKHQCDVQNWNDITAVACGEYYSVGLKADGTVVACGSNSHGQCNVTGWRNVVAVSCGYQHTAALRDDGTVVACGWNENNQCDVSGWKNITAVVCGYSHTVGLKANGTVVASGGNGMGQSNVSGWHNIIQIATCNAHTVGLKGDGTVVACGGNEYGQCDVGEWKDIIAVACGSHHTVGVKADGTVVACGHDGNGRCTEAKKWSGIINVVCGLWCTIGIKKAGLTEFAGELGEISAVMSHTYLYDHIDTLEQEIQWFRNNKVRLPNMQKNWIKQICIPARIAVDEYGKVSRRSNKAGMEFSECDQWEDIVAVAGNYYCAIGLRKNGTVVYSGSQLRGSNGADCWENITQICSGSHHVVGLRQDGTVVACGSNEFGQCNVSGWTDVVEVYCGARHTVGLCRNGRVEACGDNEFGQCNVGSWANVVQIACGSSVVLEGTGFTMARCKDGTVRLAGKLFDGTEKQKVADWKGIVQIATGTDHAVGLCADGTVKSCGNDRNCADARSWNSIVTVACGHGFTLGLTDGETCKAAGNNNACEWKLNNAAKIKAIAAVDGIAWAVLNDGRIYCPSIGLDVLDGNWKVFDNVDSLEQEKTVCIPSDPQEQKKIHDEIVRKYESRKRAGLCQHCGGEFKGLFGKKCVICGAKKDY